MPAVVLEARSGRPLEESASSVVTVNAFLSELGCVGGRRSSTFILEDCFARGETLPGAVPLSLSFCPCAGLIVDGPASAERSVRLSVDLSKARWDWLGRLGVAGPLRGGVRERDLARGRGERDLEYRLLDGGGGERRDLCGGGDRSA